MPEEVGGHDMLPLKPLSTSFVLTRLIAATAGVDGAAGRSARLKCAAAVEVGLMIRVNRVPRDFLRTIERGERPRRWFGESDGR